MERKGRFTACLSHDGAENGVLGTPATMSKSPQRRHDDGASAAALAQKINHDHAQEWFTDALRGQCGRGKKFSAEGLSDETGIPLRTLISYQTGQATPGLGNLLKILAVLGPRFANDILSRAGLGHAARLSGAADSYALNQGITGLAALIGGHLVDGRFDHVDIAEQLEAARDLQGLLSAFIASAGKGAADRKGGTA